jgi:hypothetical protein
MIWPRSIEIGIDRVNGYLNSVICGTIQEQRMQKFIGRRRLL